jgi:hypothetical protein
MAKPSGTKNIVAALRHSNRVCKIILWNLRGRQLERVSAAMQVPFPELTYLELSSHDETPPVIPDSFLGGSAPRLRYFNLTGIPFPGLPKVLLSATHLVQLCLYNIPDFGFISPEAMVALLTGKPKVCLHASALSSLLSTNFISKGLSGLCGRH